MLDGSTTGAITRGTDMMDGPTTTHGSHATPELSILSGCRKVVAPPYLIQAADDRTRDTYRRLRHHEFVDRQGLFERSDLDDADSDPRTVVLVAIATDGTVIGGVRLAPATADDIGWWTGSRLVVTGGHASGVGAALVRAACAHAESAGILRFDATVQDRYAPMFIGIGWHDRGDGPVIAGRAHRRMTWPIGQIQRLADATKSLLSEVLNPFTDQPGGLGPAGFRGDDGVPVPDSDLIAACDAIIPSMVERDPEWAGWCSILVNINDLSAMGAVPVGALDAVGAPTRSQLTRIVRGVAAAARAWQIPVLGGHTQVGVPAALSVTALGRSAHPVAAGGGKVGHTVSLVADLGGSWRPGYDGRQWDSTSTRSAQELSQMTSVVGDLHPAAAKDVSMAGLVGTLGMLAEAAGTGAELDVAAVPRPPEATLGSWLTCFPGYAMLIADDDAIRTVPGPAAAAPCGSLTAERGVRLRWPDGEATTAIASTVTGLGRA